jgi:type I restriction enzyme M protein
VVDALTVLRKASDESEGNTIMSCGKMNRDERNIVAQALNNSNYREYEKRIEMAAGINASLIEEAKKIILDALWLHDKFGEGEYKDILGLCKLADRAEIAEKGYSLTPGAYVGVAPVEDDGVDFAARMAEIHSELITLQVESNELMDTISKNMKEMGL